MALSICLECGTEMPYDWAPCSNCGWKAPETWDADAEDTPGLKDSPGFLSNPRPWIVSTAWILLGLLGIGLAFTLWRFLR